MIMMIDNDDNNIIVSIMIMQLQLWEDSFLRTLIILNTRFNQL